jgi:predicted SnoaL-like aldol condensation-catalyzing enzyme
MLSDRTTSQDSAVADGTRHNDIRLRAYELYVQREQQPGRAMDDWLQAERERNKALVLQAFDTLFNKRDYAAAERFWSSNYIQHSVHIEPGREGLFNLIKSLPSTLKYEPGTIVAEGDFVIVHGRFSGFGQPVNWIAADIVRIKDGVLAEHWDVIQDEATKQESKSGLPMFGDSFSK